MSPAVGPERSWAFGAPMRMENSAMRQLLYGSTALPFVIPSGLSRLAVEAEGSAVLQAFPGNVFRPERSDLSRLAVEVERSAVPPLAHSTAN